MCKMTVMGLLGCENINSARSVSMIDLKKWGYLEPRSHSQKGTIIWSREGRQTASIGVSVVIDSTEGSYMSMQYRSQSHGSSEWADRDYRVQLEALPCRYGGRKWFFRCPLGHCQRRSRYLYCYQGLFICRRCTGLWYDSQTYTTNQYRLLQNLYDAEKLEYTLKRRFYRGQPTRKYRRYLKLSHGMDRHQKAELKRALLMSHR